MDNIYNMKSKKAMQQVYYLFGEAMLISTSLGWSLMMLWLIWLSEEGKKILGISRWSQGYCSTVMEDFIVGAAPVRCTTARLKQDKRDNINLMWYSNNISNR
jgi:hypothetical protein